MAVGDQHPPLRSWRGFISLFEYVTPALDYRLELCSSRWPPTPILILSADGLGHVGLRAEATAWKHDVSGVFFFLLTGNLCNCVFIRFFLERGEDVLRNSTLDNRKLSADSRGLRLPVSRVLSA